MINCILLVPLLLVSMALLKYTNFPPVIYFLNFIQLFHLQVLLSIILPVFFAIFLLSPLVPNDYSCKGTFSFVSQIKNAYLSRKCLVSYNGTNLFTNILLQEAIDIAINLIYNHNPNLNITKKTLKTFPFCYITDSFYFKQ